MAYGLHLFEQEWSFQIFLNLVMWVDAWAVLDNTQLPSAHQGIHKLMKRYKQSYQSVVHTPLGRQTIEHVMCNPSRGSHEHAWEFMIQISYLFLLRHSEVRAIHREDVRSPTPDNPTWGVTVRNPKLAG